MAKYQVKPGYCLHLPHQNFAQAEEEVDLNGELEPKVLETQGFQNPGHAGGGGGAGSHA